MALIRKAQAGSMIRDAVVLDLGDLQRQGQAIIDKARQRADALLKKAEADAKQLLETTSKKGFEQGQARGYEEGLAQGRKDGIAESRDAMAESIQRIEQGWTAALTRFNQVRSVINQEARVDVLRLAVMIGEQIVYRTIEMDPTIVEDQIAEALRLLSRRTAVSIRVNPGDLSVAEQILPALVAQIENCIDASLVPDDAISPGGCVLSNGRHGEIDAQIEAQIERIVDELVPGHSDPVLPDAPETLSATFESDDASLTGDAGEDGTADAPDQPGDQPGADES